MEYLPWYNVSNLMKEISAVRRINFAIVEQRQQALERLGNIDGTCPFEEEVRFPDHGLYVCEGAADWGRKFQQLRLALMFKEQQGGQAVTGRAAPAPAGTSIDVEQEARDSRVAFMNATTAMFDQVKRRDGVYNRDDFEGRFTHGWIEPAAPVAAVAVAAAAPGGP